MKKALALIFLALLPVTGAAASDHKSYAMPRTHVAPIRDSKADRQYELYVKLPEGYSDNTDVNYPVIYTTDAVWHMDMLSGATEYLTPDVILVGISWQKDLESEMPHVSRFRDYTVVKSSNPEHQTRYQLGQASNHLSFIRDDVITYMEDNYRADPKERTYFGYSLGGVFGAYVLLAQPDTFNHYILGSPALDQSDMDYFYDLEAEMAPQQQELDVDVFVSIGELERAEISFTKDFVSVLQRRGEAGLSLTGLQIIEDSDHGSAFPETVIRGVKWLTQRNNQ